MLATRASEVTPYSHVVRGLNAALPYLKINHCLSRLEARPSSPPCFSPCLCVCVLFFALISNTNYYHLVEVHMCFLN